MGAKHALYDLHLPCIDRNQQSAIRGGIANQPHSSSKVRYVSSRVAFKEETELTKDCISAEQRKEEAKCMCSLSNGKIRMSTPNWHSCFGDLGPGVDFL